MKLSVVICTHNRDAYLPECLENMAKQEVDYSLFEIIVVNNNCTDDTEKICLDFKDNNPELNFVYTKENKPGLSHARNKGIEIAKGDIISFIDDDGFAREDYVAEILKITNDPKFKDYISFGGKVIPRYNEGMYPNWLSKHIEGIVSKVDMGDKIKSFDVKYPAGCNMIFRKEFFELHGGFNTDLKIRGDDKFVFFKLKAAGLKILYVPTIYVNHFIDDYRLEEKFIRRLSLVIGNSERVRLKSSKSAQILKFMEYLFKYGVALILAIGFIFKGEFGKAKYIVLVRWNVIVGFFKNEIE